MKRIVVYAIISVLFVSLVATISLGSIIISADKSDEFYVGVTFCGNSTAQAKMLVDKVSVYTNLFVLQSGSLMSNTTAVNEIGDYAVANGLHFAVYLDVSSPPGNAKWLGTAVQRWGTMFAGVYYGDEPAGKMLDTNVDLTDWTLTPISNANGSTGIFTVPQKTVYKQATGELVVDNWAYYYPNGTIKVNVFNGSFPDKSFYDQVMHGSKDATFLGNSSTSTTTYYPSGIITVEEITYRDFYYVNGTSLFGNRVFGDREETGHNLYTPENGTDRIAQKENYAQVLSKNPIPTAMLPPTCSQM